MLQSAPRPGDSSLRSSKVSVEQTRNVVHSQQSVSKKTPRGFEHSAASLTPDKREGMSRSAALTASTGQPHRHHNRTRTFTVDCRCRMVLVSGQLKRTP